MSITVTEAAIEHFKNLIQKENVVGMNLRIYAVNPKTIHADIGVTFCPAGEEDSSDTTLDFPDFQLFIDKASEEALHHAKIDYEVDELGGQLSITAPNLKGKAPGEESSLHDRVQYVLDYEVNPGLAGHGGRVQLCEILDNQVAILQFGGGCHGCGMVNVTLKQGIEKTLKEKFPQITEVRDITDHAAGENPYY